MTKNQKSEQVGDGKSPALQATESGLRVGVDQAEKVLADQSGLASKSSMLENLAPALKAASIQNGAPTTCRQTLWLSFFFDGTGNNREADLELLKHSNIVRLFRAHKPYDSERGLLSVYIPGIGTYFPEIGDDGGGALELGCGAMGEERLDFALGQFDEFLSKPLSLAKSPANAIEEINIAVFGFSRGAALSRAFLNMVMEQRCILRGGKWTLRSGAWPVRFRFVGLFDTVASVGLPMSSNTTGIIEGYNGDTVGMIKKRLQKHLGTRPETLAFFSKARPGADPAPGDENGHRGWGARLRIHETVEEVRHFIAAHEVRNSFPVDSVSVLEGGRMLKPANYFETVYPGAHSDVGGGYMPGEGGKGIRPSESLSLIPLRHMYDCAKRRGVPMLAEWKAENDTDFDIDSKLRETYDHYQKVIGSFSSLGAGINKHMELYYAWRFKMIRRKAAGDRTEARLIQAQDSNFRSQEEVLKKQLDGLERAERSARLSLGGLMELREIKASASERGLAQSSLSVNDAGVEKARQKYENTHDERLKANAKKDSLPNMKNLQAMLNLYDRQLLVDVQAIRAALYNDSGKNRRSDLRPHYKALLEAYENEFEKGSGLKDEKIISFFDSYVHDSLAGFGKDATLPSDPRVVYVGASEKYRYASLENPERPSDTERKLA